MKARTRTTAIGVVGLLLGPFACSTDQPESAARSVALEADDLLTTLDGFTTAVRFGPAAALSIQVQSGARKVDRRFLLEDLRAHPSEAF